MLPLRIRTLYRGGAVRAKLGARGHTTHLGVSLSTHTTSPGAFRCLQAQGYIHPIDTYSETYIWRLRRRTHKSSCCTGYPGRNGAASCTGSNRFVTSEHKLGVCTHTHTHARTHTHTRVRWPRKRLAAAQICILLTFPQGLFYSQRRAGCSLHRVEKKK